MLDLFFMNIGTNNIMTDISNGVIRLARMTFMSGHHILERVLGHETIHRLHRKKFDGVLLNIEFGKPYDKVKWLFL
jgi:hypothetical protein